MRTLGLLKMFCAVIALCSPGAVVSTTQTFALLYGFCPQARCTDGAAPQAALLQANDGNFYETTSLGGNYSYGITFKFTPSGSLATLYSFDGADGAYPRGAVIQATDGNLYGTTSCGGDFRGPCNGTIFKATPGGTPSTLYSFCSQPACTDGVYPQAGLIQATSGNFYGTTYGGGANGYGTIFQITPKGR